MQNVDYVIVSYLCGIMAVLAVIIAIGASRQRARNKRRQQDSLPETKE